MASQSKNFYKDLYQIIPKLFCALAIKIQTSSINTESNKTKMDPAELGELEIELHDDDTFTTSGSTGDVPYVLVLELAPLSGPDNWSYQAIANWFSNIDPEKILAGIILMIFAIIIIFLRIKIRRGNEEVMDVTEQVQEEVDGIFTRTVSQVMSFFVGFGWNQNRSAS